MMFKVRKSKAFSVLEAMLFLVIAALVLMMTMRYFKQANDGQRVNSAITMVQKIHNITQEYAQSYNYDPTKVSVTHYKNQGLLPALYEQNPWGGDIEANVLNSILTITLTNVPAQLCVRMINRMNPTVSNNTDKYTCDGADKSYSGGGSLPNSNNLPDKVPDKVKDKAPPVTFTATIKIV